MTPTQAQARSIAEQIARDTSCVQGKFHQRVLAIIPYLTAAAEVGVWRQTAHNNAMQVLADRNAELMERIKQLTAAAEVGEPTPDTEYAEGTIGWAMAVKRLQDNATIERCAQVADNWECDSLIPAQESIADAIRALKDKP